MLLWATVGAAAAAVVVLRDIGVLLSSIASSGSQSYGPGVFTGIHIDIWDTTDYSQALELWRDGDNVAAGSERVLRAHILVDLAFIVAYTRLIFLALRRLRTNSATATRVALAMGGADLLETLWTGGIIQFGLGHRFWLTVGLLFTLLKWLVVASALVVAIGARKRHHSVTGVDRVRFGELRILGARSPGFSLLAQGLLVGLFGIIVAVPAGGPLEQIPDILRYHLDGAPWHVAWLSTVSLLVFTGAITVSGLLSLTCRDHFPRDVSTRTVLIFAAGLTAALVVFELLGGRFNKPALAPVAIVAVLAIAAWIARRFKVQGTGAEWVGLPASPASEVRGIAVVGALAGSVVVISGIGLVRASSTLVVLGRGNQLRWWLVGLVGLLTALFGGAVTQFLISRYSHRWVLLGLERRRLLVGVALLLGAPALVLTVWPEWGRHLGATGSVAVSLALYALLVVGLQHASRHGRRWPVTTDLWFGSRTPWALLIAVTFVLASVLNTDGGYHDVRSEASEEADAHDYSSLTDAFSDWSTAQTLPGCETDDDHPLVIVAAPGGGVRAAYWTASALEALFPTECARRNLFAVSGVSGGSVGTTLWTAHHGTAVSSEELVNQLSGDEALASALAGMFLRDLPQPLTGITDSWRDRAALMEDGWIEQTGVLGTVDSPLMWPDLTLPGSWNPVLVLNSSSVTEGCRILISNVDQLTSESPAGCLSAPGPSSSFNSNSVSRAAIDPLPMASADSCDSRAPLAVSAALLSARFPLVTPSGSVRYCSGNSSTVTYGVDGGYYENTGLLSAIEISEGIATLVEDSDLDVEPWILVLDNHYRSEAVAPPPSRPLELLAPFTALSLTHELLSATALEQAALLENQVADCPRFFRVGPRSGLRLAAPLGWVLSTESRTQLDEDLEAALVNMRETDSECVRELVEFLAPAGD